MTRRQLRRRNRRRLRQTDARRSDAVAVGKHVEKLIAKLLYDSHYANEGAAIAAGVGDKPAYERLKQKSARLHQQAEQIDPGKNCRAWEE